VRLRLRTPSLEAVPWEMAGSSGLRLTEHRGVRSLYRGPAAPTVDVVEIRSVQAGLRLAGLDVPEDGTLGPDTHDAIAAFQRREGLHDTGHPDPVTVQLLHRWLCGARTVTVVRLRSTRAQAKGSWSATPIERLYGSFGFDVHALQSPGLGQTIDALRSTPTVIVHISTPLLETGGSVALDVATEPTSRTAGAGDQPGWLTAAALDHAFQGPLPAPIVVLDPPRPTSEVDSVVQLLLRNTFAGELFALGNTRAVFGVGLAALEEQDRQYTALLEPLAEGARLGDVIRRVREAGSYRDAATLHARSAELLLPW
jgi:peptidoglycan hydrolase-like protein with peptidoglycan-binding domain